MIITRRFFLAISVIGLTCATQSALAQPSCNTRQPDFIQISSMQLDAGKQIFEDFRILSTDVIEWARWDSNGALLGHAIQRNAGKKYYDRLLSLSWFSKSINQSNDALGRPAFRLDLAHVSKSAVRLSTMTTMPNDLASVIGDMRTRLAPESIVDGLYLWTKPFGAGGPADIDLTQGLCSSGISKTLMETLNTGRLLVHSNLGTREFRTGERANRIEFIAKTQTGSIRFGVVGPRNF